MKVTLYTTHCPKCAVLLKKLEEKGIEFDIVDDADEIIKLGYMSAPLLKVDEAVYDFGGALNWLREN